MNIIILSILIFLELIQWVIIIDIIFSWIWVRFNFIQSITLPMYSFIKKYIPTSIWPFDFTPMIIFIIIILINKFLLDLFPEIYRNYIIIFQNIS